MSELVREPWVMGVLGSLSLLRFVLAGMIPLGNDEAYYWDWGRDLALSYFDHPPGVAWLAALGQWLLPDIVWQGRALIPCLHLLLTIVLLALARLVVGAPLSRSQFWLMIVLTQLTPITNLGGFMLMPDAGLLLFTGLLLYLLGVALTLPCVKPVSFWFIAGLLWGLAFSNKYHGLMIGGCAFVYTLSYMRLGWRATISAMFWLALGFILASSPVWLWNFHHDFLSFRFQSTARFAELSFHLTWGLRILLASMILLTPLGVLGILRRLRVFPSGVEGLLLTANVPLLALFVGMAFFREVLPHWPLPMLWLLLPLVIILPVSRWWLRVNLGYSLVINGVLIVALGFPVARQKLLIWLQERPQGLGELTVWPYLVDELAPFRNDHQVAERAPCTLQNPVIGTFRWYWAAQLALHLPDQPKVVSVDSEHLSYYWFRDQDRELVGCPAVFIGSDHHFRRDDVMRWLEIKQIVRLTPRLHLDQPTVIIEGVLQEHPLYSHHHQLQSDRLPRGQWTFSRLSR
jgi:4-amino-4-deoxy-L-arabinose transferase-like glycosyltransferase